MGRKAWLVRIEASMCFSEEAVEPPKDRGELTLTGSSGNLATHTNNADSNAFEIVHLLIFGLFSNGRRPRMAGTAGCQM